MTKKFVPTPEAYELLHMGQIALAEVEHQGVRVDKTYLETAIEDTSRKIRELEDRMRADPTYRVWRRRYGEKTSLSAPAQLAGVVFGELGYPSRGTTASGNRDAADESAFEHVDLEFVKLYFQAQKLRKGRDTYLTGIRREMVHHGGGIWKVHPSYNLHTVQTFRSSCDNPNWTNVPNRNPALAEIVRRCYIPSPGNQLIEIDYCLHPDTRVKTVYGDKRIGDIKEGDKVLTFRDRKISWSVVTKSSPVKHLVSYRITFDNGESVIASADHKWPIREKPPNTSGRPGWDGPRVIVEKRTEELKPGDRMIPCKRAWQNDGRPVFYSLSSFEYTKEHVLVAEAVYGPKPEGYEIHHKDEDPTNNHPDNLEYKTTFDHQSEHAKKKWEGMSDKQKKEKIRQLVSGHTHRRSYAGAANPNFGKKKGKDASCLKCGKVFYTFASAPRKYCGKDCYWSARRYGLNHKVVSIEPVGMQPMHAITVDRDHNYVLGCGVVTLNCQIEVRVSACYHRDPTMIAYIRDPATDMHRDQACRLFFLRPDQINKPVRHLSKNLWVFPQFYGDFYPRCAQNMWEAASNGGLRIGKAADGPLLLDHLRANGITGLGACDPKERPVSGTFEAHVQAQERYFWDEWLPVYSRWKKDWLQAYYRDGGCMFLTGFPMMGPHKKNDITNYPIQGSSFHCVLWSLPRINAQLRRHRMRSRVIGEIHDCIVGDVPPGERDDYIDLVRDTMVEKLMKAWPWVIVPLDTEVEVCDVGASWFEKKVWTKRDGVWTPPSKN